MACGLLHCLEGLIDVVHSSVLHSILGKHPSLLVPSLVAASPASQTAVVGVVSGWRPSE